jgi:hypothetical protein
MFGLTKRFDGLWSMLSGSNVRLQAFMQMLNPSVLTKIVNLGVIGVAVSIVMSTGLDRYETSLEDELVLRGENRFTGQVKPETRSGPQPQRLEDYRVIVVRNLFKTTRGGVREASDSEEVKIEEMPLASLKLKLMGTVVTSDPAMRTAIIAEANGRNERMYREGESINGVTIKKILRFAVVLNTGQRDEVLKMETPEKKGQEGNQGESSELSIKRTPS